MDGRNIEARLKEAGLACTNTNLAVDICSVESELGRQGKHQETLIRGCLQIALGCCSLGGPGEPQQGSHGCMAASHATDLPAEPQPPPFDPDEPFISLPSVSIKALQSPVCGLPCPVLCIWHNAKHQSLRAASHSW